MPKSAIWVATAAARVFEGVPGHKDAAQFTTYQTLGDNRFFPFIVNSNLFSDLLTAVILSMGVGIVITCKKFI